MTFRQLTQISIANFVFAFGMILIQFSRIHTSETPVILAVWATFFWLCLMTVGCAMVFHIKRGTEKYLKVQENVEQHLALIAREQDVKKQYQIGMITEEQATAAIDEIIEAYQAMVRKG